MIRRTFAVAHNIPSPYRVHLFSALYRELKSRNTNFEVHFFSRGHTERPASWRNVEIPFPHRFWPDYGLRRRGSIIHFNPGLFLYLSRKKPDYLLTGGPWDTPSGVMTSIISSRTTGIAWIEVNTQTPGQIDGIIGAYKRYILKKYDFIAVPGDEGKKYLDLIYKNYKPSRPDVVLLPNIIDENRFYIDSDEKNEYRISMRKMLGISSDDKLATWPARLLPVKGVVEFLSNIDTEIINGWKILIIGEGYLSGEINKIIKYKNFTNNILMKPYFIYEQMPALYAASDLFLLASMQDPNPLSVVEAMHSGLPLLLSCMVGNFPEALHEEGNGWGFDPRDSINTREAARKAFSVPISQLREMGRMSSIYAQKYWSTPRAVTSFLDSIGVRGD